ncbi:MAG: GAF domain-containing protein [Clostridia bacterium]|nr:GAF domain-containing protein [Clostridia bacterium]
MNEMNVSLKAILDKEDWLITSLSNASAVLNEYLDDINWVGFYLMKDGDLVLGPFQGKSACVRIKVGKGVCGTCVMEDKTQLVADVHKFPGHIACDSASNSEIVIPIHHNGEVVGVLDIDSPLFDRFSEEDKENLEESVKIIESIWK